MGLVVLDVRLRGSSFFTRTRFWLHIIGISISLLISFTSWRENTFIVGLLLQYIKVVEICEVLTCSKQPSVILLCLKNAHGIKFDIKLEE